jgi:hypothetical protein
MSSEWVKREYTAFYTHCYKPSIRRLIPVLVKDYNASDLPLFFREIQACKLVDQKSIKEVIQILGGTNIQELQKENEKLQEARKRASQWIRKVIALAAIVSFTLAIFSITQWFNAEKQRNIAEKQMKVAEEAEKVAEQRLEKIVEGIKLRQAVLSRDTSAIKEVLKLTATEKQIQFRATATEYPYKSVGGFPTYKFQLFPEERSIPGGIKSIALITYIMDHPTFLNPLISTGPDTKFVGVYDGVGCLNRVIAVIEYADLDKPTTIAQFNMCEILEERQRAKQ